MSKQARAFILGVTLAAMSLAGLTTVAPAQANDPTRPRRSQRSAGRTTTGPATT
jgi:hypothetical protein